EPRPEAQDRFIAMVDRKMRGTVWTAGGCKSWYLDRTGRNSTLWPGFTFSYARRARRFVPADYHAEEPRAAPVVLRARDRIQKALGRRLGALSAGWHRRIGGPPLVGDGQTLASELQVLLAMRRRMRAPALSDLAPVRGRLQYRRDAAIGSG